jgi:hypothetical protein
LSSGLWTIWGKSFFILILMGEVWAKENVLRWLRKYPPGGTWDYTFLYPHPSDLRSLVRTLDVPDSFVLLLDLTPRIDWITEEFS